MEDALSLMARKVEDVTQEQKQLLYHQVEELKRFNAALQAENDLFERFLGRMHPEGLLSKVDGDHLRPVGDSQLENEACGRRGRSGTNNTDGVHQLTLEQKMYVIQAEVAETRKEQEKLQQKSERLQDSYMASMKEAELRLTDIWKAKNKFERRMLKPMKLEMKEPEKILQYIEDKSKLTQMEKFNLKNQALKVLEKKLQQQLQQKRDMGKTEYEEIFQDYSEEITDKNLDELQVNNLKVQRVLSSHKEKLQSVMLESTVLSTDITNRKQMLAKIEEKIQHAEKERFKAEALNQRLCRQITDYEAPDITEYMHLKDKHKKLQQNIHTWERKLGIAQLALKTHTKAWHTQRAILTPADSVETGPRFAERRIPVKLPSIAEHSTWRKELDSLQKL
ncbi:uncharacterized protein V6R79_003938 [Siganus canaliculatus]